MEFAWVGQGPRAHLVRARRFVLFGLVIISAGLLAAKGVPQLFAASAEAIGVKLPLASVTTGTGHGSDFKLAFDRSTLSGYAPAETEQVIVELAVKTQLSAVKLFGPSPYIAEVEAEIGGTWQSIKKLSRVDLRNAPERWNTWTTGEAITTSRLKFTFEPQKNGNGSDIREIEIWGEGLEKVTKSPRDLLGALAGEQPPEHATVYQASPEEAVRVDASTSAATFQTSVREAPEFIKNAWLVYELNGIGHLLGVNRSVNGQAMGPVLQSTSSAWSSHVEQLDPQTLQAGSNTITFGAVDEHEYEVRNVMLLVEQDNGLNFVESVEGTPHSDVNPPRSVRDGDENSGWTPYFSGSDEEEERELTLRFDKPTQLEGFHLTLRNQLKGQIEPGILVDGEWVGRGFGVISGAKLMAGSNWISLDTDDPVEGLQLRFTHGEGSSAEIMEVIPVGSGVGGAYGEAINIVYPTDGQFYGRTAYLRGFVKPADNGSGTPAITIAGKGVETEGGRFEGSVTKDEAGFTSDADDAPWSVTLTAEYPDGQIISRELILDKYGSVDSLLQSRDAEGNTAAAVRNPYYLEYDEGVLDLESDSMDESPDTLTITALTKQDLPPLNPGMTNVTRGPREGYRFGPHGKQFKKHIRVDLPYDKDKLPPGMTEADIRTYYYDEHTGLWRALERTKVDNGKGRIHSRTNHFTDMINATIVVPEHPEAASFNPTQIKDIKAADPGAGINLIEPPQANNTGDARLSYPIEIPPGRAGMQPQLAIQYSSGGGNGWLGLGWDLSVPSFSVETRWGVPRFDSDKESETYLYNGSQLAPVAHRGSWDDLPMRSSGDKRFYPRVEGKFSKIIRHGASPTDYWWEVVDKNGTRNYFGGDGSTQKADATIGSSEGVVRWMLVKSIDAHGNTVDYEYETVCDTGIGKGACDNNNVNGKQLYLSGIAYTGHSGGDPEPLYTIGFLRDSARSGYQRSYQETGYDSTTDRRLDVQIDARGGFKQVTAERLWRIIVKYDDAPVRSYELEYEEGAFGKSLLSTLLQKGTDGTEFNRHAFSYYDELPEGEQKGEYSIFEPVPEITTPDDELFTKTFTGQDFHQTLIGGTHGRNQGFNGFFGVGVPLFGTEVAGTGRFSANSSTSEGKVALLDVDGDGKPDKVFLKGGEVRYRKNITEPGAEIPNFDEEVKSVRGLTEMSRSSSDSSTDGQNGYAFGATAFRQKITTTSTDKAYFADVNGDGLIDHVNNGRVSFGYRDTSNSEVSFAFSGDSGRTKNPIAGTAMSTQDVLAGLDAEEDELKEQNPLMDAVRRWEAPYDGTIRIEGTVGLYDYTQDPDEEVVEAHARYETADGVLVMIQKNSTERWRARLEDDGEYKAYRYDELTNLTAEPKSLDRIAVSRGDEIYFRVSSWEDGSYDRVEWSPRIIYVDGNEQPKSFLDVNNLNVFRYDTSEDTIFAGTPVTIPTPYNGEIRFNGLIRKPVTTDDVVVNINIYEFDEETETFSQDPKEGEGGSFTKKLSWDAEGEFPLTSEFTVEADDKIVMNLNVDSPIDLSAIEWATSPEMYYTSATQESVALVEPPEPVDTEEPEDMELPEDKSDLEEVDLSEMDPAGTLPETVIPVTDEAGNYTIKLPVRYNADIYSADDLQGSPQKPWVAEYDGVLLVTPWLSIKTKEDICDERPKFYWWRPSCESLGVEPTPDGDITFTVKRRGERIYKEVMEVRDEQVVAGTNGYEALALIPVEAGDELFFDFTTRDVGLLPRIQQSLVRFDYGSRTPWNVPISDTVTVATKGNARDLRESEDWSLLTPSEPDSTVVILIRRGDTLIDMKKVKVPAGGFSKLEENFTLSVSEGEPLYFDFFTAEDTLRISDTKAWTRYAGAAPWAALRDGRVTIDPVLTYKPDTQPNGNLLMKVFRNDRLAGQREYRVVGGELQPANAGHDYPLTLTVDKGDRLRHEFWTDTHRLSSTFADKGQVSIDYVDIMEWSVPEGVGKVDLKVEPTLEFDFGDDKPDGAVIFTINRGSEVLAEETYLVEEGRVVDSLPIIDVQVNGGDRLQFTYVHAGGALLPYLASYDVSVTLGGTSYRPPSVFNATDLEYPVSSLHILMPRKEQVLPVQDSVVHFPEWNLLYGNPYRGWAQAAYLARDDLADRGLIKDRLQISENEEDHSDWDSDVYPAMPSAETESWDSVDGAWGIGANYITSTRRGLKYIDIPRAEDFERDPTSGRTAGIVRVPRFSLSKGYSNGGGFILTKSWTRTTTNGQLDLMDLNGDRYPDIVSGGNVQYTHPDGGMGEFLSVSATRKTFSSDSSLSYGGGTEPPTNARGKLAMANDKSLTAQKVSPSISIGGSFGEGDSDGIVDFIDMNGDGLLDRVTISSSTISVQLNLGYDFAESEVWGNGYVRKGETRTYAFNMGWSHPGSIFSGGVNLNLGVNDVGYRLMDINGDGLTDYVYADSKGLHAAINFGGSLSAPVLLGQPLKTLDDISELGPLGNAALDAHFSLSDGLSTSASVSGSGAGSYTIWATFVPIIDLVWGGGANYGETVSQPTVGFNDINGDGFVDSIRSRNGNNLEVSLSQIRRTNLLKTISRPLGATISLEYQRSGNTYEQPQSRWVLSRTVVHDGYDADTQTTGGANYAITGYDYLDGYYDRYERDFYGYEKVIETQYQTDGLDAAAIFNADAPNSGTAYRNIERIYENGSYYRKGLLAEERLTTPALSDETFLTKTVNTYNDEKISDADDRFVAVFPQLRTTTRFVAEPDQSPGVVKETVIKREYDAYGNITTYEDSGDDSVLDEEGGDADAVTATIDYAECTAGDQYIVDVPTAIVIKDDGDNQLRKRTADFNCATANLDAVIHHLDGRGLRTDLTYDEYGNLKSVIKPPAGNGEGNARYTLSFDYDDATRTHIETITDSHGYISRREHSYLFGKPTLATDINGNHIENRYDAFGRLDTVYHYGKGESAGNTPHLAFYYEPDAEPPYALTEHYDEYRESSGDNTIDTYLFIDGLGRVIQTKKDAAIYQEDGTIKDGRTVSGRVVYDGLGRATNTYYPVAEYTGATSYNSQVNSIDPKETEYDTRDRPLEVTFPDRTTMSHQYAIAEDLFRTTTWDQEGQKRETYRDIRELIRKVVEYDDGGIEGGMLTARATTYDYDPLKQITTVTDAADYETTVSYDALGRRTAIDNPDTGLIEKIYDDIGNVVRKITPNLRDDDKAIVYRYDFHQLTDIEYPNDAANDVHYDYGEPGAEANRAGRIAEVRHGSGYEQRWYGTLGELVKETKYVHLPGDKWHSGQKHNQGKTQPEEYEVFTTTYDYDTFGRLQSMVFPDGEKLSYAYNSGGLPERVSGSYKGTPYDYVSQIGYDEFEQRVRLELGNGAVTDYSYDDTDRRLDTLKTISNGIRFQNLGYDYDNVGNISKLTNLDVDISEGGMGGEVSQTLTYDSLHRLTYATGTYQGAEGSVEGYTLDMDYDAIHNITRKNQTHTVGTLEGDSTKKATTYDWTYRYDTQGSANAAGGMDAGSGRGSQPHAPTRIGELDEGGDIVGRTFNYDANGNQLGWSDDKNATYRAISWDDENRIQSVQDNGKTSTYGYDDQGERVIKQSSQNLTVYVNPYFSERNGSIGSKHIFVGNSRIVTKVTGGTSFIRSYDGVTDAKTPPGQAKKSDSPQEKSNNGNDKDIDQSNNGNAVGKDKEKTNNGKALGKDKNAEKSNNGQGNEKANGNTPTQGSHPGQGLENRSEQANEVAQNTCKNKHLIEEHCDEDGDGIPDSQEEGTDEGTDGGIIGDNTDGTPEEEIVTLGSNGEQLFYYHPDHLGSTGYVTRENGEVHEHIQYFPFGETWVQQGGNTEKSPYLFTGKELDEETGLYYFGARYYDPRTSVWVSPDPILGQYLPRRDQDPSALRGQGGVFLPVNLGMYSYAALNPVKYVDPDGNAFFLPVLIFAPEAAALIKATLFVGSATAAAYGAHVMLNEGQSDSDNAGNESGRKIGEIDIPADATPDGARDILTDAGYPPVGNTQDESTGTDESGTVHEVDVKGNKTRVRVMDGKGNNGPRISVNSANNPKQPVDPTTGKPFKGNISKQKQREQSHIPLEPPSSE